MKTFSQFISEAVEAIGEASKGNAFDMELARQRLRAKALDAGNYNRHDVKRTATGLIATRRFDKDDTAADPKKDASGGEPVKRGRGRPPGKYGSYKKRVKESLDIIESLDSEEEIEQFIASLDEESFAELVAFLDELEQLDEENQ